MAGFDPYAQYANSAARRDAWVAAGSPVKGWNAQYGEMDLTNTGEDALSGFRGTNILDPFGLRGPTGGTTAYVPNYGSGPPAGTTGYHPLTLTGGVPNVSGSGSGGTPGGPPAPGMTRVPTVSKPGAPLGPTFGGPAPKGPVSPMPLPAPVGGGVYPGGYPASVSKGGNGTPLLVDSGNTPPPANTSGTVAPGGTSQLPPWLTALISQYGGGAPDAGTTGPGTSTATQQTGLDPRLDAFFQYILGEGLNAYNDPNGRTYYQGQTVAGLTPDEIAAQNLLRQFANSGGLGPQALQYYQAALGRGVNPGQGGEADAAIEATLTDMRRQATDPGGLFSQIRGGAQTSGQVGGSRQGVLEGVGLGRVADAMGRTSANMRLGLREQDIGAASGALAQSPNVANVSMLPGQILSGIGTQNRMIDQALLDQGFNAWAYQNSERDRRLMQLLGIGAGTPLCGWSSGSSTLSPAQLALLQQQASGGGGSGNNALAIASGLSGGYQLLRALGIIK